MLRLSLNVGLPILECPEAISKISDGDEVEADFDTGIITDKTTGECFQANAFPEFIKNIMASGGLVGYTESELKV